MVLSSVEDTIVARATPLGRAGIGVVRVSGSKTENIAKKILGHIPKPRVSEYLPFLDKKGALLDRGIVLFFKGPHSFTGEDVLELHGHGGPVIMECLIREIIDSGARLANPGEFSLRAVLNDKIDLVQAEAIADLINASSEQAARSAVRSLNGEFSETIKIFCEAVIRLRMFIEAALDFPDEDIELLGNAKISSSLFSLKQNIHKIMETARLGALLTEGLRVVIIGPPNAGKSSLLNKLAGYDAAIVTDIPGTTRDVLREQINIDGLLLQFMDTAGLRESEDVIEQEGIKRALQEMKRADHVIILIDGTKTTETDPYILYPDWMPSLPSHTAVTVLYNKIDLLNLLKKPIHVNGDHKYKTVFLSAKTGEGIQEFREHLKTVCGFKLTTEGNFTARRRHLEALKKAEDYIMAATTELQLQNSLELVAENLRQTQLALDEITGKFTNDDLLGKIFSEFCIGK